MTTPKRISDHAEGYIRVSVNGKPYLYHRWVMEQTLGRKLPPTEVVHHRDGNKKNNDPLNLELHSGSSHSKLHKEATRNLHYVTLTCATCGKDFERRKSRYEFDTKRGMTDFFCSRSCIPTARYANSDVEALQQKKERDLRLVDDRNRGVPVTELMKKYSLSKARVYQILKGAFS